VTPYDYADVRREFWKTCFGEASSYEDYLALSPPHKAKRFSDLAQKIPPVAAPQQERLRAIARPLNVLVVSGIWCGDCVRQVPMIRHIAGVCGDPVHLRVIDRDVNPALRDEVRILGAMRVPVAVFLSEDFFEVARFGDRTLSHYRRKAKAELGAACPVPFAVPPSDELASEQAEWADVFERVLLMVRLSPLYRERYSD